MKYRLPLLVIFTIFVNLLIGQIPNGSFEDWDMLTYDNSITYYEPTSWDGGLPILGINPEDEFSCLQSDDVIEGNFALTLRCGSFGFEGDCRGWVKQRFASTEVPTSFSYYLKKNVFFDASFRARIIGFYQNNEVFDFFEVDTNEDLLGYVLVEHDLSQYAGEIIDSLEIEFRGANTIGFSSAYGDFNVNIDALSFNDDFCTNVGESCDDGNEQTTNDVVNSECECEGTVVNTIESFSNIFEAHIVNDNLNINSNSNEIISSVSIFNMNGQELYNNAQIENSLNFVIDLSNLNTNLFVVLVRTESNALYSKKIFNN